MARRTLGQHIRYLRTGGGRRHPRSLRQFAEDVGISAPHQCDIEHGRRRPSDGVLRKIAQELGAAYAELYRLKYWR